jgi:hypothetical protein
MVTHEAFSFLETNVETIAAFYGGIVTAAYHTTVLRTLGLLNLHLCVLKKGKQLEGI